MSRALKSFCLLIIGFAPMYIFSQEKEDPILLTVAGEEIKLSEFEAVYKKNNPESNQKALEEYLELYIKFRLKVKDAEAQGRDTSKQFKRELAGYRTQLAQPYLSDNQVTEELVKQAYERMQVELNASHIMVKLTPTASPKDTLAAFNKIMDIRKRIEKGEDFSKLARELSEDPSAKDNDGNLGYFSVLYMVYSFENVAYGLKVAEVSQPVRTPFGYHLVKLEDKRSNQGEITVAHIMTRIPKNANEGELEASRMKITEIYEKLEGGESFEVLAKEFSEDKTSGNKGGLLPPFSAGKMVISFEKAAFALENDGDYSKPVQTEFGFHIVKRISLKPVGSFEEMEPVLKQRIARDQRSKLSKSSFIKRVKEEYGFKEDIKGKQSFYNVVDDSFLTGSWTVEKAATLNGTLFTLGDTVISIKDFAANIEQRQPKSDKVDKRTYLDNLYNQYVELVCTTYEDYRLEKKYLEFRLLMREYHDGILLFDLTDEKVWSKAVKDTVGLEAFYEAHKAEYMWDDRLHAIVYSCQDESTAASVRKLIKSKKKDGLSNLDILKTMNETSQLTLEIDSAKFSKGDNEVIDKISWKKGITDNVSLNNRVYVVEVLDILPPEIKLLPEIRGFITSAYQNQLEEAWIVELREKYPVVVHKEYLSQIK